ncbi:MAG: FKBP-type peptidyl-prolyl cis-trans isomerase [Phycisphaerales bacterium]
MKTAFVFVVALAGLAASAIALQTTPTSAPAQPTEATAPATPPAPKGIPVPDMPVVKTETLEGGLIVEDLKIGDGYEVKPGGAVVAFYHGTRKSDGKVFDSAFERGEPIGFSLNGVIAGWQKGVPGMKVGGIRRLTIPSAMGYGERGAGEDIPANTDLVFVIQLTDAVNFTDTQEGTGEAATGQFVAVTDHTIKDADGKEVEKHDSANPYIWIPGELQGFQYGMEGMKVGGKRKIHVPKEFNPASPNATTGRPTGKALDIEVHLIALRNLPMMGRRR